MSRIVRYSTAVATLCLGLVQAPAGAQQAAPIQAQVAPSGVVYVSGGIGQAGQAAMKQAMNDYTLRLTFARPQSGAYLADVHVRIDNISAGANGVALIDTVSTGPMFFARVPDGRYVVHAQYEGRMQSKTVDIRDGRAQEAVIYFPAS